MNWLERHERIEKNPLKRVQKVQTNGRQVRVRRAFTDEEMVRLLKVSGPRQIVYQMAVFTGLRRAELAELVASDIHLDADQPFIIARASTTENHKQATIALHPDLVEGLRQLVKSSGGGNLLRDLLPKMTEFREDLKKASIIYINADGKRADFH